MKIRIYDAGRHRESQTGYGQMAKQYYANLKSQGHDVKWFSDTEARDKKAIYLWMRPPHYVKYDQFDPEYCNIFFTMHELDKFDGWKSDWPQLLNMCAGIITPSQWNKQVFQKAGVGTPIAVVPLGTDPKIYYDRYRSFSALTVHENLGGDSSRENWQETLATFFKIFYGHPEYKLTVKTWKWKPDEFRKWFDGLIKEKGWDRAKVPQIHILDLKMEPVTMAEMYRNHHVFIKNTKGEGWSLPVSEAFACGCFIIASNIPVLQERLESGKEATFFANESELEQRLVDAHRDWKKVQGKKEAYSWSNVTKKLVESLEALYERYKNAN